MMFMVHVPKGLITLSQIVTNVLKPAVKFAESVYSA